MGSPKFPGIGDASRLSPWPGLWGLREEPFECGDDGVVIDEAPLTKGLLAFSDSRTDLLVGLDVRVDRPGRRACHDLLLYSPPS